MPYVELKNHRCPGCGGEPGIHLRQFQYCGDRLKYNFKKNTLERVGSEDGLEADRD